MILMRVTPNDMNDRRKPVAPADNDGAPLSRERESLPLVALFFALTWPTCSVRYARRVIHRNPSTTAIQPARCKSRRCNGSETTGYKSRRELGSRRARINPISSLDEFETSSNHVTLKLKRSKKMRVD